MTRPLLYDVYSGAGGAGRGYQMAGFRVVGIDNKAQPRYAGDGFIQMDAFDFFAAVQRGEFESPAAWHASPPCQGYSRMRHLPWLKDKVYPMLIDATRDELNASGLPWVIENVEDAPLLNGVNLCGTMFGLKVYRHRKFESNVMLLSPPHHKHEVVIGAGRMLNDRAAPNADGWVSLPSKAPKEIDRRSFAGHFAGVDRARIALGIDWMTRDELAQAIPPVYCEFIGAQLLAYLQAVAA